MNYFLKMMDGEKFTITEKEAQEAMLAKTDRIFINSIRTWINMKSVSTIFPDSIVATIEEKKELMHGVLHDGTLVKRHFGQWVDAKSETDFPIKIDPTYYPEIALDLVFTENEYSKIKDLPTSEKLDLLLDGQHNRVERLQNSSGQFEKLSLKKYEREPIH